MFLLVTFIVCGVLSVLVWDNDVQLAAAVGPGPLTKFQLCEFTKS